MPNWLVINPELETGLKFTAVCITKTVGQAGVMEHHPLTINAVSELLATLILLSSQAFLGIVLAFLSPFALC